MNHIGTVIEDPVRMEPQMWLAKCTCGFLEWCQCKETARGGLAQHFLLIPPGYMVDYVEKQEVWAT